MHYRQLGTSDLTVSEIALGSWLTYGGGVEKARAISCIRTALDLGITLFDTAQPGDYTIQINVRDKIGGGAVYIEAEVTVEER